MTAERFTDRRIVGLLREAEPKVPVKNLSLKRGFSDAAY